MPPEESSIQGLLNPMCEVFPRVASCKYWRYGTGGGQTGKNLITYSKKKVTFILIMSIPNYLNHSNLTLRVGSIMHIISEHHHRQSLPRVMVLVRFGHLSWSCSGVLSDRSNC